MTLTRLRTALAAAGALAALSFPAVSQAATSYAVRAPLDPNVLAEVPNNRLRYSRMLGAIQPAKLLTLNVHLAYPHPDVVRKVDDALNDPRSPMYGRFLSPSQFVANFAPTPATYARVARELERNGLHVTRSWGNRKYLTVRATASTVQSYFRTRIARVSFQGKEHFVNVSPAVVPSTLKGTLMAVSGLDDFEWHSHYRSIPMAQVKAKQQLRNVVVPVPVPAPPVAATLPPTVTSVAAAGINPPELQTAYDYPIHQNKTITGTGVTIAIEAAYGFSPADIYAFWELFGVNRTGTLTEYDPDGNVPAPLHPTDSAEVTLDVEQSTSAAPGANVKVYTAPAPLVILLQDTYNAVVSDGTVDVVSTSFGNCEINTTGPDFGADNDLFEQGSIEGQTMFSAAGDDGSSDCRSNTVDTVDFPASSPEVGSAGGTKLVLKADNTIASETSWTCDDAACDNGAGGGGVSTYFSIPPWQKGLAGTANQTFRNAPDVSLNADTDSSYAAIFFGTADLGYGGTSLVGPNLAGIYAQFEQYGKHRMGRSSTSLYYDYAAGLNPYAHGFHDITAGDNRDTAYALSVGFPAMPGFDEATGVGSLDAYQLMLTLPVIKGNPDL